MTDEFLTEGLRDDRYLKAVRLIEQFEDEIEAVLREFAQQLMNKHPDLFNSDGSVRWRTNRSPGSALATHRINYEMTGPRAPSGYTQKLNVHLYWMPPAEYNRTDINGALRAFGYKIKGADQTEDKRVAEQTRRGDWSIQMSGNPFDSNTVFYKHVSSVGEIRKMQSELVNHFDKFGQEYQREIQQ